MVTAICFIFDVYGAELLPVFLAVCYAAYFGLCMKIRHNRDRNGIKNVWIGLLVAEVLIDLIWAMIYYPNGSYVNYGLRAVYGGLLPVPVLAVTLLAVTCRNRKTEG